MLLKASFAAVALVGAAVATHSVSLRDLYNEMYPPNGLKREVFGICHDSDPTFIRAVKADRVACNDSMPHNIALAIGWTRHGTGYAAPPPDNSAIAAAEAFLKRLEVAASARAEPVAALPCPEPRTLAQGPRPVALAAMIPMLDGAAATPEGGAGRLTLAPPRSVALLPGMPAPEADSSPGGPAQLAPATGVPLLRLGTSFNADLGDRAIGEASASGPGCPRS